MKILILGGAGNLGQQLVNLFIKENNELEPNEIISWDKTEIDVTDKELLGKKINDLKPNLIINCVAYNAVDNAETAEGKILAFKLNQEVLANLAQACLASEIILVHYSSDYVFSGEKADGYKEDDQPEPINVYGQSKLAGEKEIIKLGELGLKYYLIRTSKLFGPKGISPVAKPSFFDIMLNLAKEKTEINVVDEEKSCFTYTPDLAKATKNLIEAELPYGIYHLTNSGSATWLEATEELFRQVKINIKINHISSEELARPAKRPKYSVLLDTKINQPLRLWQEALKEYLNSQKSIKS